ncbi:MAG TPA: type II toxin-antitoxin system VapC family toxin [Streptosporangiaceae bacterium]|nr:type II toxin-antitoxin system VapC family toxin [Streptosporangiaceae bacterium]
MSYLLDTNAISEWVRPRPDPGIARWLDEVDEDRTYLSVITLGELRKGVDRLADGRRRDRLDRWLAGELPDRFGERILPVDAAVADEWGRLLARAENAGTAVGGIDALISATAKVHGLQVVSRNVAHFRHAGVGVICPWSG